MKTFDPTGITDCSTLTVDDFEDELGSFTPKYRGIGGFKDDELDNIYDLSSYAGWFIGLTDSTTILGCCKV